jgi:hypothetical protein
MSRLEPLERRSATAFLIAGAFLIGFVVRNGIIAFGDGFSETMTAALYVVFIVPAMVAAYIGLLGLYPQLSDHAPRLAGAGAVFISIAGVAIIGFGGGVGSAILAAGQPDPPAITQLLWPVTLVTTIVGFLLFGVASLRTRVPSRMAGFLLLVPPITYILMMAGIVVGFTPGWSTVTLSSIQAGAHLAIGVVLRNDGMSAGRAEPAHNSAA